MESKKKISGGRVILDKNNRHEKDNYPTPICATESLLSIEEFYGEILEPACGDGHISRVLIDKGYEITSSDLRVDDDIFGAGGVDFFTEFSEENKYDNIITNPPYDIAKDFVKHCHKVGKNKIALLLRLAFVESENRFNELWNFDEYKPDRIHMFIKRLPYFKNGEWHKTGGQYTHAWYVWDLQSPFIGTQLNWLDIDRDKITYG